VSTEPAVQDELESLATLQSRDFLLDFVRLSLDRKHKRLWCEKSLTTPFHIDAIKSAAPEVKFIILHRHPMDVVASLLEATKWGFDRFGLASYVASYPTNLVDACARYWLDRIEILIAASRNDSLDCHIIKYEDLVLDTEATMEELLAYLNLANDVSLSRRAFDDSHDLGSSDYKIAFTHSVISSSVGRGHQVPVDRLSADTLERLNKALVDLDYEPIDMTWNLSVSVITDST
jgi:hypothetical protein